MPRTAFSIPFPRKIHETPQHRTTSSTEDPSYGRAKTVLAEAYQKQGRGAEAEALLGPSRAFELPRLARLLNRSSWRALGAYAPRRGRNHAGKRGETMVKLMENPWKTDGKRAKSAVFHGVSPRKTRRGGFGAAARGATVAPSPPRARRAAGPAAGAGCRRDHRAAKAIEIAPKTPDMGYKWPDFHPFSYIFLYMFHQFS